MPPKKKAKTTAKRTMQDFVLVLSTLSNLYEREGDARRAQSFSASAKSLEKFGLKKVLTSSADYEDVKGVGKSTLQLMDEFIESGTCARLDAFDTASGVDVSVTEVYALKREEATLEFKCGALQATVRVRRYNRNCDWKDDAYFDGDYDAMYEFLQARDKDFDDIILQALEPYDLC